MIKPKSNKKSNLSIRVSKTKPRKSNDGGHLSPSFSKELKSLQSLISKSNENSSLSTPVSKEESPNSNENSSLSGILESDADCLAFLAMDSIGLIAKDAPPMTKVLALGASSAFQAYLGMEKINRINALSDGEYLELLCQTKKVVIPALIKMSAEVESKLDPKIVEKLKKALGKQHKMKQPDAISHFEDMDLLAIHKKIKAGFLYPDEN